MRGSMEGVPLAPKPGVERTYHRRLTVSRYVRLVASQLVRSAAIRHTRPPTKELRGQHIGRVQSYEVLS